MEDSWRECLKEQSRHIIVDPKDLMQPVKGAYPELCEYLSKRYYNE